MSTLFSHFFAKNQEICPLEHNFTEVLNTIALMPKMLYFYGKIPENVVKNEFDERPKCVAIVGSRKCTKYGENIAYELAFEVAKRGGVVISGLAFGIDAAAHRGAVDAGGKTIAVLGTSIDKIYPVANLGLAEKIIENDGCIMSEYGRGADFFPKTSFLERNRLISGLSDVVVVVEAAFKSGALNTASHALEQGRDLFVVPGDIDKPMSKGCNRLIKQGAEPYTEVNDVLDLLFPVPKKRQKKMIFGDTPEEMAILKIISSGIFDGEEIIKQTGLATSVFNQTITMLEIKDMVKSLGMNQWKLK